MSNWKLAVNNGVFNFEGDYWSLERINEMWRNTPTLTYNVVTQYNILQGKTEDEYIIKIAVPGVKKEDIDLVLHNKTLEVLCEVDNDFTPSFAHAFDIEEWDKESIKKEIVDGVLIIKFDRKEEYKSKTLKI